jgi:tRNA (guanine26-N2/guanine27-N2)-dimethyltransferase
VRFVVIREGDALLEIPDIELARAPHGFEPAWLPVFYNPRMEFNRDVSVLALATYIKQLAPHKPIYAVDALSGTGVRAIRYALEVSDINVVHANDIDPLAYDLIKENVRINNLKEKIVVHNEDANTLLINLHRKEPLLFIDIDPFGSPAPFTQTALHATGHRGLAAFTATDLAVLEGSKSRAARRKYWVHVVKTPESKEIGLRVLLGYIARTAAFNDKRITPLLSFHSGHYYRVFVLVERGARKADKMLEEDVGYLYYCPRSRRTQYNGECPLGEKSLAIGPLWVGKLNDADFISNVLRELETEYDKLENKNKIYSFLQLLLTESMVCEKCVFYRLDIIASTLKRNMPKINTVIERLQELGYKATRTHLHPVGIRTDAPYLVFKQNF